MNRSNGQTAKSHLPEVVAMLALSAAVITVVSVLAAVIDLSAEQAAKISIAYVILGGMLLDRLPSFSN